MKIKFFLSKRSQLIFFSFILLNCLAQCTSKDKSKYGINKAKKQLLQSYDFDRKKVIEKRIEVNPERVLEVFRKRGINAKAHKITTSERIMIDSAFALLPQLHKRLLKQHLVSFSFFDSMPVSAMTVPLDDERKLYQIAFNASILNQTVSEWLTEKERNCFNNDNSSITVSVDAGSMNALVYILIHESTHIVDGAIHILPQQWKNDNEKPIVPAMVTSTWSNWLYLLPAFQNSLLNTSRYRKGGEIFTKEEVLPVYQALKRTPLVSIYSASNWHEDLAEYFTVYHLTTKLGQPYSFILRKNGKLIFSYKPMESHLVRSRMDFMNLFYK